MKYLPLLLLCGSALFGQTAKSKTVPSDAGCAGPNTSNCRSYLGSIAPASQRNLDELNAKLPDLVKSKAFIMGVQQQTEYAECARKEWPMDDAACVQLSIAILRVLSRSFPVPQPVKNGGR